MRRSEYLPIDPTIGMTYEEKARYDMLHEPWRIFPPKITEPNRLERIPDEPLLSEWVPEKEE